MFKNVKLIFLARFGINMLINRFNIFFIAFFVFQGCFADDSISKIQLSQSEKDFLSNKQELFKCVDPKWMPFESINSNNQHVGIIADIMDIVSTRVGIPITLVTTKDWSESHEFLQKRFCDVVSSDAITNTTNSYFTNTVPFLLYKDVYITRKSTELALNFEAISKRKIGFVKGYPTIALAKEKFPSTNVIEMDSVAAGVLAVSRGDIYAFVDLLPTISNSMQKQGLTNLRVAGHVDIRIPVVMSIRNDQPELVSIINKALLSITLEKKNQIFNRWVTVDYAKTVDYILIFKIISAILAIAIFCFYWVNKNRLLKQEIILAKERERIMRDMHDGVGGHLIAALALLNSQQIPNSQIEQCLVDCLADIRIVILSLEPASSDLPTLLGMFKHNISGKIKSAGIEPDWSIGDLTGTPTLNSKKILNILRIMQESVTNVIKHSGASLLNISASKIKKDAKKYINITISDNGTSQDTCSNSGYGIKNMEKRAKELGGFIRIKPTINGTTVSLYFPI